MTTESEQIYTQPDYLVGIGASAGGLEALQALFKHMPSDLGASFVVIQHLSPDFKSMMLELLSKHTDMPLKNVTDGMVLEANTIYLIPPKKNMVVSGEKLLLSDKDLDLGLNLPIDVFFRSLAQEKQHKAVGIVLSGTGSDGTRGIKALKESGALAVVQSPESAKFDGMPNSAIGSGMVDLILSPEKIGEKLSAYIKHPLSTNDLSLALLEDANGMGQSEPVAEILNILRANSNIDFTQYKHSTVARRIERRMTIHQTSKLSDYLNLIYKKEEEAQILKQELLIGVTRFFRDYESFKSLTSDVIPQIVKDSTMSKAIRVWVSACSTGEEAYTIAILIHDELQKQGLKRNVKVFATDVNSKAISQAGNGVYSADIADDVPVYYLKKYFSKITGDMYKVEKSIRQMVVFATHDMISDPPFSKIDLVTCRNALIYFKNEAQDSVIKSFHFALRKGGYLFLGSSENLGEVARYFKGINDKARIFVKHSSARLPLTTNRKSQAITDTMNSLDKSQLDAIQLAKYSYLDQTPSTISSANTTLIERFVPACILINSNNHAIHVHGEVDDFVRRVKPGRVTLDISDMINDDLNIPVNAAIKRVINNGEEVLYAGLSTSIDGKIVEFDLRVCPALIRDDHNQYYWLIFERESLQNVAKSSVVSFDLAEQSKQRIQDLELELTLNKEHLQVTVEELETTNEELQSANEELMSANEELQSTNEELQSVNEELFTVNTEYQTKIDEISEANDDLDTVLELSKIGIVFLDNKMTIRRYTNAVTEFVNLQPTDIGRPIHHFSRNIRYDRMLMDVAEVFETGQTIENEVVMPNFEVLRVTINPHTFNDQAHSNGVAITFSDVSKVRYMEKAMETAYKALRKSVDNALEMLGDNEQFKEVSLLFIDDSDAEIALMVARLESISDFKLNLFTAHDVTEASQIIDTESIDVCIADFYLHKANALDFVSALNDKNMDIPVIVVTNDLTNSLRPLLIANGVLDLINKADLNGALLERCIKFAIQRKTIDRQIGAHIEQNIN